MQDPQQPPVLSGNIRNCRTIIRRWIDANTVRVGFDGQVQEFLSADLIAALASAETIRHLLDLDPTTKGYALQTRDQAEILIYQRGKRMFCMAIYNDIPMQQLHRIMLHVNDDSCPFHSSALPAGRLRKEFRKLTSNQHRFRARRFSLGKFKAEILASDPVPIQFIRDDQNKLGKGANASVYRAALHTAHHNFTTPTELDEPFSNTVAIKVFNKAEKAVRELNFLQVLASHRITHPNILTFHGGFQRGGHAYLFSERADYSLTALMTDKFQQGPDKAGAPSVGWILTQMLGLAKAMETVHDKIPGRVGFHHDIKPDNILMVKDPNGDHLKIMDWGCAEAFDSKGSYPLKSSTGSPCSKSKGNPPYTPPECNAAEAATSRPHDVWSLGCVFLHVLIWCGGGWKKLEDFRSDRRGQKTNVYFERGQPDRILGCVQLQINSLISDKNDTRVRDLGTVVNRMLDCDPSSRSTMADVVANWPS